MIEDLHRDLVCFLGQFKGVQMRHALGVILLLVVGSAQAALIDRGEGFIYDDVLDVTWAQNANINGADTWDDQVAWADDYSQTHSVYGTFDDWRLATTLQPDASCSSQSGSTSYGYNCTGSEMGHLFNVDGISSSTMGLFTNVQSDVYWSGTEYAPITTSAWNFYFSFGFQGYDNKDIYNYAWAVRDGDVAASVVPIPAAAWLFGSGLGLLGWLRRRQNA